MRNWGVNSEADFARWLGNKGFPVAVPGRHLRGLAQGRVLRLACVADAREPNLEAVYATATLRLGRQPLQPRVNPLKAQPVPVPKVLGPVAARLG